MYRGSNELFGRNKNFLLVSNIKLHLKMSVNYKLQISPPSIGYNHMSNFDYIYLCYGPLSLDCHSLPLPLLFNVVIP